MTMSVKGARPDLLKGGLLAAFTAAAAACAGGAQATTLAPPVVFDLLNPGNSLTLDIDGNGTDDVTISGNSAFAINIATGVNSVVAATSEAATVLGQTQGALSFNTPNDIGRYSDYASNPFAKTATGTTLLVSGSGQSGDVVNTNLPNGAGYLGLFLGAGHERAFVSFTNAITTDPTGVQDDVLTVSGYGVSPVPEPETWALLVTGAGAVGFALRRRRQALAAAA